LLVIDGDSFAHRSYHALPKTIRLGDGKGAGAILGFANFLLRIYTDERRRAVIVGWDTLEAPTKRHETFPAYQSGREFAEDLIEQLSALPKFVSACGFANAKAPGFEADDFLAAAVAAEGRAGGSALVASGDRDSFQLASPSTTILYPSRGGEIARIGPEESGSGTASTRNKFPTSLPFVAILPTNCPVQLGLGQHAPLNCWAGTARWAACSTRVFFGIRRKCFASIASSPRWTRLRRCPRWPIRSRHGSQHRALRAAGG
jgi:hypothetical protein